jgi:PAS domain S-box-containing protein
MRFKELWDNAPVAYHTLDNHGNITSVNQTEAKLLGYSVKEMIGKPVFDFVLAEQQGDAVERFQQKINNQSIEKSENRVYVRKDGSQISVDIDDVLDRDQKGNVIGIRTTMVDISGRKRAEEELKFSLEKLHMTMESIVHAMAKIVEMKDPYTAGHQRRVAQLACAIAEKLNLPQEQIDGIYMASVIHDIGKIYVPAEILSKPGRLTEIEFGMIKIHPKVSYDILKMVEFPWPIAKVVLQHHERIDGSGYPFGLMGTDILIEAKILSVSDVVEAIAFHRPYRSAVGIEKALEEIVIHRGSYYDPLVVDTCIHLFKEQQFQFL